MLSIEQVRTFSSSLVSYTEGNLELQDMLQSGEVAVLGVITEAGEQLSGSAENQLIAVVEHVLVSICVDGLAQQEQQNELITLEVFTQLYNAVKAWLDRVVSSEQFASLRPGRLQHFEKILGLFDETATLPEAHKYRSCMQALARFAVYGRVCVQGPFEQSREADSSSKGMFIDRAIELFQANLLLERVERTDPESKDSRLTTVLKQKKDAAARQCEQYRAQCNVIDVISELAKRRTPLAVNILSYWFNPQSATELTIVAVDCDGPLNHIDRILNDDPGVASNLGAHFKVTNANQLRIALECLARRCRVVPASQRVCESSSSPRAGAQDRHKDRQAHMYTAFDQFFGKTRPYLNKGVGADVGKGLRTHQLDSSKNVLLQQIFELFQQGNNVSKKNIWLVDDQKLLCDAAIEGGFSACHVARQKQKPLYFSHGDNGYLAQMVWLAFGVQSVNNLSLRYAIAQQLPGLLCLDGCSEEVQKLQGIVLIDVFYGELRQILGKGNPVDRQTANQLAPLLRIFIQFVDDIVRHIRSINGSEQGTKYLLLLLALEFAGEVLQDVSLHSDFPAEWLRWVEKKLIPDVCQLVNDENREALENESNRIKKLFDGYVSRVIQNIGQQHPHNHGKAISRAQEVLGSVQTIDGLVPVAIFLIGRALQYQPSGLGAVAALFRDSPTIPSVVKNIAKQAQAMILATPNDADKGTMRSAFENTDASNDFWRSISRALAQYPKLLVQVKREFTDELNRQIDPPESASFLPPPSATGSLQ